MVGGERVNLLIERESGDGESWKGRSRRGSEGEVFCVI